jgi:hypothetical protein
MAQPWVGEGVSCALPPHLASGHFVPRALPLAGGAVACERVALSMSCPGRRKGRVLGIHVFLFTGKAVDGRADPRVKPADGHDGEWVGRLQAECDCLVPAEGEGHKASFFCWPGSYR